MPNLFTSALAKTPKTTWGALILLWRWKFWIVFFLVLTPTVIVSIQVSIETNNPTYPFFQLALRIFTADNAIERDVNLLRDDPLALIGISKPTNGIWMNAKYYWRLISRVWFVMLGNVYLIFLPLIIIYRLIRFRNISEPAKNLFRASWLFLGYLFITNTVILIRAIIKGNTVIMIPEGIDTFMEYFLLVKFMLPFHGLYNLVSYLVETFVIQITLSLL